VKKIGLIGGVGWRSTAEYYRLINEETARRLGGLHSARLALESLDFAAVRHHVDAGQEDALVELYTRAACNLEDGGAQVLGLCSNAAHTRIHRLRERVRAPFIHIAEPIASAARAAGYRRVALLGTRETMEHPFLKEAIAASGVVQVLVPSAEDRAWLHGMIFGVLEQGRQTEAHLAQMQQLMARQAQAGADAVVLGCTELPLLVGDAPTAVPCLDSTRLHAAALVEAALAGHPTVS
jgi:aspartate racemase